MLARRFSPLVKGHDLSVTAELGNYFARVVYDQKANFTPANSTRLALGFRF